MKSGFVDRLTLLCGTDNMAEIARKTGVPYNTLKNYLTKTGASLPSAEVLMQIRQSSGASIDWLLTGKGLMYAIDNEIAADQLNRTVMMRIPSLVLKFAVTRFGMEDDVCDLQSIEVGRDSGDAG
jgi:transcriptional regulator with XRE-family HTH domain